MAHTNTNEKKKIPLGSGDMYVVEFSGSIPADSEIETESNMIGSVKSGATIEYKPTYYTAKSDDGKATKTVLSGEDGTLKYGQITWNGETLKKLASTARVTTSGGKRTTKIGGLSNYDGKKYLLRFLQKDPVDGDLRVTVVGVNTGGFSAAFANDKESQIDPEFTCEPLDDDGTLIVIDEEVLGLETLSAALTAGSTSGKTKVSSVSPSVGSGNSLKYKIGSASVDVAYDDVCSTGWTALTVGTTEISATAGQVITVVEVDSSNKAKKCGTVTVVDNIG